MGFSNDLRAEKWNEQRFIGSSADKATGRLTDWLTDWLRDWPTAQSIWLNEQTRYEIPIYSLIEHRTTKATARRRQYAAFEYIVETRCKKEERKKQIWDFFFFDYRERVQGDPPLKKLAAATEVSVCVCAC